MNSKHIAPCGINCGLCLGYLRDKNRCLGCRASNIGKPESKYRCVVKTCPHFENDKSKFCYDCPKFPCRRIKQLDQRYRTKYNYSPIDSLLMIKEKGIRTFLKDQKQKWTCLKCGGVICVHRGKCLKCSK
jgi:hypothetical protein